MNLLQETVKDDIEKLALSKDEDATVTSGEKHDGKELKDLVKKSLESGVKA